MGSRPHGGPVAVSRRDFGKPVHAEQRCAHDHRVFEVEETKSAPRPDPGKRVDTASALQSVALP
jgi:hypothetical protein